MSRLVEEARNLVPMCARRYLGHGVPFDDLVGAGYVGLVEATYRFDPGRGLKFGTYAVWWIRRSIATAIEKESSLVLVPRYSRDRRRRVLAAINARRKPGTDPKGPHEVAEGLGLTAVQVDRALASFGAMLSLESPVGREGTRTLGDLLASPAHKGPEAVALIAEIARRAQKALRALSPRQRTVLSLRFGLGTSGDEPLSLLEIARMLGRSRERVRQIETEALRLIRRAIADDGLVRPRRVRRSSSSPTRS
jgi:RNA polymerase sigma factor (sigma-70 family)